MLPFRERSYLNKIYSDENLKFPPTNINMADYHAYCNLQVADYLYNMSEDELYWDSSIPDINSHQDVIDIFDLPIRGTYEGVELDPVIVPKGYKFIADVMSKIPLDVLFLKGRTGVGATTLAAQESREWIICLGSRNIVKSKSRKHQNSIGVFAVGHGGATDEKIESYEGNTIFTTWASLPRLMCLINVEKWSLLLDENQEFIRDGGYRGKDINYVLKAKDQFKHCTLMSATETAVSDYRGLVSGMDVLKIKWEEKREWNIEVEQTELLQNVISELARRVLDDDEQPNVHVFVNKLELSIRVVNILEKVFEKDLSDKISIVASNKPANVDKIQSIGAGNYELEDESCVKRVNFYTSTSFSGVDIEDSFGDIVMAVDGNIGYTRLDIHMDMIQIIGRIRNPRENMGIWLVFSKGSLNKKVSREDFKSGYNDLRKDAIATEEWYNKLSVKSKEDKENISRIDGFDGLEIVDGKAVLDHAFFMNKGKSYLKDNTLYTELFTSGKTIVAKQGSDTFKFTKGEGIYVSRDIVKVFSDIKINRGADFKTLFKELLEGMTKETWDEFWWKEGGPIETRKAWINSISEKHDVLIDKFPFVKETLFYFSPDKITKLGLIKRDIKNATKNKVNIAESIWLKNNIRLTKGVNYTKPQIKEKLKQAYSKKGIDRSVPATAIKKLFPAIQVKQIRVDKKVKITSDEYCKIKSNNYNLPKSKIIFIDTDKDRNGHAIRWYKFLKNEGRQDVYVLPFS